MFNFQLSAFQLSDFQSSYFLLSHWTFDLGPENWSSKSQVFATIYETEGLEHHMAVERAHVSRRKDLKKESYIHIKEKGPVFTLCNFDSFISSSQSIFGKLDVDHDGDITEEEFIQVFQCDLFEISKLEVYGISQDSLGHFPTF